MAGFDQDDIHFNPRVACEPPKELSDKIFPWIEGEIEKVFEKNESDDNNRITAVSVLRFWASLRNIILQDAAAMFVLHPERVDHPFLKLPIFRDPLFLVSSTCRKCCCCF